jgi:hypothetical protein
VSPCDSDARNFYEKESLASHVRGKIDRKRPSKAILFSLPNDKGLGGALPAVRSTTHTVARGLSPFFALRGLETAYKPSD